MNEKQSEVKRLNYQPVMYNIPGHIRCIVRNIRGMVFGFVNPPVRVLDKSSPAYGEWVDSTDGSYGTHIPYDDWQVSIRDITSFTGYETKTMRRKKAAENAKKYRKSKPYFTKAGGGKE